MTTHAVEGMSLSADVLDDLATFVLECSHNRLDNPSEYTWDDVHDDITTKATAHDLTYLGDGSNRIVFADPKTNGVVKFALDNEFRTGSEQNRVEAHIWNTIPEDYLHRFFPVHSVSDDYNWLVTVEAETTDTDAEFDPEAAVTAIYTQFPFLDDESEFLLPENLGWLPAYDSYAILDYGSFIPRDFITTVLGYDHLDAIGADNIA
mgnify:CR=1 FL=1